MSDTARQLPDTLSDLAESHPASAGAAEIVAMLETMVLHPEYPCLGARSVFRRGRAQVVVLKGLPGTLRSRRTRRARTTRSAQAAPHSFEQLRAGEQFGRMRDTIRRRDKALQGTCNPMVEDYGTRSEARQYAGREVRDDWEPPVNLVTRERPPS